MEKLLIVLAVVGIGLWFLRRGSGCCGVGGKKEDSTQGKQGGCH